ncbi:MAG TPA: methyltransferase [Chitinophagaceae bacterium]
MKVTTDASLFGAWVAREECVHQRPHCMLDIGAGTGLLSLMYAQLNPEADVLAVEVDKAAALQAAANIEASAFKERISVFTADIRAFTSAERFDVVMSNPPFYENDIAAASAQKNIARHGKGLLIRELLSAVDRLLSPDGHFYVLLPYKRLKEIRHMLEGQGLKITDILFARQSVNHDFFRMLVKGGRVAEYGTQISELSIWDENRLYTPAFRDLLKGYYLQFP